MADNENEFLQMGVSPELYEALERDFKEVLQSMVGEKTMERFKAEYEKLHRALKTSYDSEKRLVKQVKDLNEIIVSNAARVKAAIKLTQEDSSTIGLLKKEVDKAWKLVETAKEKEEKARKIIGELKSEIAQLHKTVELGSGLQFSQDNTVQNLLQTKNQMEQQLSQKTETIQALTEQKIASEERANRLENDLAKEREDLANIMSKFEAKKEEHQREERKTRQFEISDAKQKELIGKKDQLIKIGEEKHESLTAENNRLEEMHKNLHDEHSSLQQRFREQDQEKVTQRDLYRKLEREKDALYQKYSELLSQLEDTKHSLSNKIKEYTRINKKNKVLESQNQRLTDAKYSAIHEKTVTMNSVSALKREIEFMRKQADDDRSKLENLESKKEKFKSNIDTIQKKIGEMEEG
jgi:chromosome segregation ATPase